MLSSKLTKKYKYKSKTQKNNYISILKQILTHKNNFIIEKLTQILLNYILIKSKHRKIAQIELGNYDKTVFIYFCKKFNIKYKFIKYMSKNGFRFNRLLIYDPKTFDIKTLNRTFGEQFGKQLGDFYICSTNNWLHNDLDHRITIEADITINGYNYNVELYAQMCDNQSIQKHLEYFKNIGLEIHHIFIKNNLPIKISVKIRDPIDYVKMI